MNQSDENQDIVAVTSDASAAVASKESSDDRPPYLKLIADCWFHIFDYLSFEDIHTMSETCKVMHKLAGCYFNEFYPKLPHMLDGSEISAAYGSVFNLRPDFYQYVGKLEVWFHDFFFDLTKAYTFSSLKTLQFQMGDLNATQFEYAQNFLKNIENIELGDCELSGNIFERLAKECPKLKYLSVSCYGIKKTAFNELFLQNYPQLEHLQFRYERTRMKKLKNFLEKHSKLKHFSTNSNFLWANRDMINKTNVRLDMLAINDDLRLVKFEFVDFLKKLHDRGFYKSLYFTCHWPDVNLCNTIPNLPALKSLSVYEGENIDFFRLISLKELYLYEIHDTTDLRNMAKSLKNLERLSLGESSVDGILPFISHSKNLKRIFIEHMLDLDDNDICISLDLYAFNEERKKLVGACELTIGVQEDIYLATKWRPESLNLSHIKIIRFDSFYNDIFMY